MDHITEQHTVRIEGTTYSLESLRRYFDAISDETSSFRQELYDFLLQWFDDSPTLIVNTSGSTGIPKAITVRKNQMVASACMTCQYLNLKHGDTALLCMPLQYIAGKMMVVRALVWDLNLLIVKPSGHPLKQIDTTIDFAAMIPLQVHNSLSDHAESVKLGRIRNLIIGGGTIDAIMEERLKEYDNAIYSTYGMTETLSHVALRQLNGSKASLSYLPLPGVGISLATDGALIIDAPRVCDTTLYTNDIAQIYDDGSFRIKGRKDNIINSGGVKIQAEEVEAILKLHIDVPFVITSIPDAKLGEQVVLLLQETLPIDSSLLFSALSKYEKPKLIMQVDEIPLTHTGKIDRCACKKMALSLHQSNSEID